ncbi:restriction endonuclease subunit S [Aeromonas veronii]
MKAGWDVKPLGDLLSVLKNGINCKQDKSGNGVKISRIESISDATFNSERVGYSDLSEAEKQRYCLKKGDILFSHINSPIHVGKTAIFDCDEPIYHGVNLLLMRPTEKLLPEYLNFALKYLFQTGYWARTSKQSVNQASVNQKDISCVDISYPTSKEEQHRIVAILDEAFEVIATARANAEQNRQNARALFESYLQSVFSQRGDGWVERTVGELVDAGVLFKPFDGNHGEIHPRKTDYVLSGVPFIMACDLQNGGVDTEGCKFIPRNLADSLRVGFAKDGDVLVSHKGTIGRSAVVNTELDYIMLTPQVTSYRIKDATKLSNRFVRYYFMSPVFQNEIIAGAADGATRAYIGITKQLSLHFRFPSLQEQMQVVERLDALDPETQRLEALYQRKIAALDELKQSLLQQAFSGQL